MRTLFLSSFFVLCYANAACGTELNGHIELLQGSNHNKSIIVVYAEPVGAHEPPKPGRFELRQRDKTFTPHVLAVPVGSTVSFPNNDPIFHNVFSLSRPGPFDLGLYRAGDAKTRVFTQPAIYRVFCNIHPQMSALLLVLPTASITETNAEGMYHLDLPPGQYRLGAWSERSQQVAIEVNVTSDASNAPDITLDESKFVEIRHKNKFDQDYAPSAYEALKR
jgi:plastocyanin